MLCAIDLYVQLKKVRNSQTAASIQQHHNNTNINNISSEIIIPSLNNISINALFNDFPPTYEQIENDPPSYSEAINE